MKTDRFNAQQIYDEDYDFSLGWRPSGSLLTPWDKLEDEHLENIWLMLERRLRNVKIEGLLHVDWSEKKTMAAMKKVEEERERRRANGITVARRIPRDPPGILPLNHVDDWMDP